MKPMKQAPLSQRKMRKFVDCTNQQLKVAFDLVVPKQQPACSASAGQE
jgi:hypothetical protein